MSTLALCDKRSIVRSNDQLLEEFLKDKSNPCLREKLILANKHLVPITVAKVLKGTKISNLQGERRDDLELDGLTALIEAIDSFDITKKVRLTTWIVTKIKCKLRESWREYLRQNGVSRSQTNAMRFLNEAIQLYEETTGNLEPSDHDLAEFLDCEIEYIMHLKDFFYQRSMPISTDEPIYTESDQEAGREIHREDMLRDYSSSPEESNLKESAKGYLLSVVSKLPKREAFVLQQYFNEGLTFKQIAESMNLSDPRVWQLYQQAMTRLRNRLNCSDVILLQSSLKSSAQVNYQIKPPELKRIHDLLQTKRGNFRMDNNLPKTALRHILSMIAIIPAFSDQDTVKLSPKDTANVIGCPPTSVNEYYSELTKFGLLSRKSRGTYCLGGVKVEACFPHGQQEFRLAEGIVLRHKEIYDLRDLCQKLSEIPESNKCLNLTTISPYKKGNPESPKPEFSTLDAAIAAYQAKIEYLKTRRLQLQEEINSNDSEQEDLSKNLQCLQAAQEICNASLPN